MFQLVYISKAIKSLSKSELTTLLRQANANNKKVGISGILVYKDDQFVQVLEGEETVIHELFAKISGDPRHTEISILSQGHILHPEFPDWAMGFRDLSQDDLLGLYGNKKSLGKSINIENFRTQPDACVKMLRFIRELQLVHVASEGSHTSDF
jgi:hypothetical protein